MERKICCSVIYCLYCFVKKENIGNFCFIMLLKIFKPALLLQDIVDNYMLIDSQDTDISNVKFVFLPDASSNIVINLGSKAKVVNNSIEAVYSQSIYMGQIQTPIQCNSGTNLSLFCIRFKPNGFYSLFNIPSNMFVNKIYPLNDIIGNELSEIEERVYEAAEINEKLSIIENWIISKLKNEFTTNKIIDYSIQQIKNSYGALPIKELCDTLNVNYKFLERSFIKNIGFSPKFYSRIVRFDYIKTALEARAETDWFDIIARYNFHDQSHLVKEINYFTENSPQEFLKKLKSDSFWWA